MDTKKVGKAAPVAASFMAQAGTLKKPVPADGEAVADGKPADKCGEDTSVTMGNLLSFRLCKCGAILLLLAHYLLAIGAALTVFIASSLIGKVMCLLAYLILASVITFRVYKAFREKQRRVALRQLRRLRAAKRAAAAGAAPESGQQEKAASPASASDEQVTTMPPRP